MTRYTFSDILSTPDSQAKWIALKEMARFGAFTVVMLGTGIIVYTLYLLMGGR